MTEDQEFRIEIRDELKRLCEEERTDLFHVRNVYYSIRNSDLQKLDVFQILIDLITYCSMGNLDEAIKSLHLSDQFLDACSTFVWIPATVWRNGIAVKLLLEIWKLHFIDTKYHLDFGHGVIDKPLYPHRYFLQRFLDEMNNIDVGAHHENQQEHYEWCKSILQMFKLTNSDMNSHYLTALDKKQKKRSN